MPEAVVNSILDETKKLLGISHELDVYDTDVIIHINSALATLTQLGVGSPLGLTITDSSTLWSEFTQGKTNLDPVKSYIYLRLKLIFDPPGTSFTIKAIEDQIAQIEWRLNVQAEHDPALDAPGPIPGKASIWDLTGGLDFPAEAPLNAVGIDLITGDVWRKTSG